MFVKLKDWNDCVAVIDPNEIVALTEDTDGSIDIHLSGGQTFFFNGSLNHLLDQLEISWRDAVAAKPAKKPRRKAHKAKRRKRN